MDESKLSLFCDLQRTASVRAVWSVWPQSYGLSSQPLAVHRADPGGLDEVWCLPDAGARFAGSYSAVLECLSNV